MATNEKTQFVHSLAYAHIRDAAQVSNLHAYAEGANLGYGVGVLDPDSDPIEALHESEVWQHADQELKDDPVFCVGALWGVVTGRAQARGEFRQ